MIVPPALRLPVVVALVVFLFAGCGRNPDSNVPHIVNGVLDLRNVDPAAIPTIALVGEWEMREGIVAPEEFDTPDTTNPVRLVTVPHMVKMAELRGRKRVSYTYRLTILSPEEMPVMGLGLSICKRIVEAHGGSIEVDSRTGQGTVVQVMVGVKGVSQTFFWTRAHQFAAQPLDELYTVQPLFEFPDYTP